MKFIQMKSYINSKKCLSNKYKSECGAALIEASLVIALLILSILIFFAIGLVSIYLGKAATIPAVLLELEKAAGASDSKYETFALKIDDIAIGHPSGTLNSQAAANILEAFIHPPTDKDKAFLNFWAGSTYGSALATPMGFSDSPKYIQTTAGTKKLGPNLKRYWTSYLIPNFFIPFLGSYFVVEAGTLEGDYKHGVSKVHGNAGFQ